MPLTMEGVYMPKPETPAIGWWLYNGLIGAMAAFGPAIAAAFL